MKPLENFSPTKSAKDIYDAIRRQKNKKPGLRMKLTFFVCGEIIFCILLAWGFDAILGDTAFGRWEGSVFVEFFVISTIVASLLTSLVSKYFFLPIKILRQAMSKVSDGDFDVTIETKFNASEIKEVYAGFNMMTQELKSTEILQTDFVSNVSHEFKTPITAIEGYSTLLQGCENLDDEQQEYIEKILFNTKRLSVLISNILLLSKLENQSLMSQKNNFRLDEQIRQSIVGLEPLWEEKEIVFDIDLEEINYSGNENLMVHIWSNLIGNAIKFSPKGRLVKIKLENNDGEVVFTVEDRGDGISDESIKHIFDKFYQGDNSHKQEGNGLGLALVKRIVLLHNGSVFAENLVDGGCRFTVIL